MNHYLATCIVLLSTVYVMFNNFVICQVTPSVVIPEACTESNNVCSFIENSCSNPVVRKTCNKTCRVCEACYDYKEDCSSYGKDYYKKCIDTNAYTDCQVTCKICDLPCRDKLDTYICEKYNKRGLCKNNTYVRSVCKVTCTVCEAACQDILPESDCQKLKKDGKCEKGFDYPRKYCNKTCTNCML